ncbi:hypothetical protein NS506_01985 [Nocardia seriolae]|uniref:Type II toxin-antitoxin system PemK/MazF family toxin n=2 Tax=Nocardia seriolae TaxID=37332 RepID=A0ABC9YSY8_9NOCA|nr:hypothetical protein NS506_01985 [Nocardia seriolae]BEK85539.1 hypothetical protein NSERKGN1266_14900 [Nocardia seriolae]BEK98634.1 hypothetical protein NSER024013_65400 [Nocardia seriolae]GAM46408.1 hypothetical protein NS07_v2contig00030-0009 [Nocardia seriolae]GAP28401.1 hypothetical protein NSK11_contig00034-0035 [Nocardia seriolae]
MRRGDVYRIITVTGRAMNALVISDLDVAEPIGYIFITPIVESPGTRQHVTAPISAVENGSAVVWRTQAVPIAHLEKGEFAGRATTTELAEVDSLLKALFGL